MSLQIENIGNLERKVSLQFSKTELLPKREAKLKQMGKNLKMAGFRPGKVPLKIIEQQYGQQVDFELSFDHASNRFFEFAQAEKIELVGQPRLEPKVNSMLKILFLMLFLKYSQRSKLGTLANLK